MKECSFCGCKERASFEDIEVDIPTPMSEVIVGGKSSQYTVTIKLPIESCKKCGMVLRKETK